MTPELFKLSKANCCVYWMRLPEHTDMFSQGYIGISSDVKKRWKAHFEKNGNVHFSRAAEKYGKDKIIKEMVLIADKEYCLEIEKKLRPTDKIGWNIVAGGGNPPVGKSVSTMFKKGLVPWNKGSEMSDETKLKVSLAKKGVPSWNKGIPMREETKIKQSEARKGKLPRPDAVEQMAAVNRGKKRPEWVIQKIAESKRRNKELRALSKEVSQ
jgi:predicted GIY-YIG superfamily endonuclease